eukprot:scaffold2914_cov107-Cylindrotheca_fusiformis.AAC.3
MGIGLASPAFSKTRIVNFASCVTNRGCPPNACLLGPRLHLAHISALLMEMLTPRKAKFRTSEEDTQGPCNVLYDLRYFLKTKQN